MLHVTCEGDSATTAQHGTWNAVDSAIEDAKVSDHELRMFGELSWLRRRPVVVEAYEPLTAERSSEATSERTCPLLEGVIVQRLEFCSDLVVAVLRWLVFCDFAVLSG